MRIILEVDLDATDDDEVVAFVEDVEEFKWVADRPSEYANYIEVKSITLDRSATD